MTRGIVREGGGQNKSYPTASRAAVPAVTAQNIHKPERWIFAGIIAGTKAQNSRTSIAREPRIHHARASPCQSQHRIAAPFVRCRYYTLGKGDDEMRRITAGLDPKATQQRERPRKVADARKSAGVCPQLRCTSYSPTSGLHSLQTLPVHSLASQRRTPADALLSRARTRRNAGRGP